MTQTPKAPLLVHIGYHETASFLQVRVFTDRRLFHDTVGDYFVKSNRRLARMTRLDLDARNISDERPRG